MIIDTLHAWVLNRRWIGDTSAHVTFFTREQGILQASYKGGRTPKKQSHLQAFTPLWLVVNARKDWNYVRQLEIISASLPLSGENLFSALYVNELLYHALRPGDPHTDLYNVYEQALKDLTCITDKLLIEAILRRFEAQLLLSCGYQVSYAVDVAGRPVKAENNYRLIPGEGFVLTSEKNLCGSHLLAISQNNLSDVAVLKTAKYIMRRAIDHALEGKPIRARELYRNY